MLLALFPTLIKAVEMHEFDLYKEKFSDKALNLYQTVDSQIDWRCDTYSSLNSFDMISDPLFKTFNQKIITETLKFSKEYGVTNNNLQITDAWLNVAKPGAFQEYHIHTASHFSAVYYVKSKINSGNIVFRSFEADTDMFPLPVNELTPASFKTISLPPEENKLLIFRSNLKHMVEKNNSDDYRISISINLCFK